MATTTTEQIVRQSPFLEDFQKRILEAAFARGETPVEIPDIQVAPLDPLTQQAITTGQGIGQFMPFLQTGADTLGTGLATLQERAAMAPELFTQAQQQALGTTQAYDPTSAAAFMDPYQEAVTQDALAEMRRQADIQRNQLAAQAVGAGAFGGSRQGIMEAEAQTAFENQQRRQQGVAQLLGGLGSTTAQEASRIGGGIANIGATQANLAGTGQSLIGQQAQLFSQLGATQQTQAQRELDAARQGQLQQSFEPFQRVSFMSDIFKPQIGSAQSTIGQAVAPSPSPISQAIGAGIAGFGLNRALGNPFGDLFGGS